MGKAAKWGAGKLKNLASKALPKFKTTLQESAGKFVSKISGAFSSPSSSGSGMRNRNRGYVINPFYKGGSGVAKNKQPDLYHYTDADSAKAIQESGMIRTDRQGRIFVTTDQISPQNANNALFMGRKDNNCATHRIDITLIDPYDNNLTSVGATQPNELIYNGTLRNGRNAILTVKENDF